MDDSDKKEAEPIPAPQPEGGSTQGDAQPEPQSMLDVARRFLQTDEVRQTSREEKAAFLRTKDISETDIAALLDEDAKAAAAGSSDMTAEPEAATPVVAATQASETPASQIQMPVPEPETPASQPPMPVPEPELPTDRAPIVTYPEFLTRRERAPPLVTVSGFLHTASAFAGFATLVYGASQYVLAPMVSSLTDSRAELHEQVAQGLDKVVSKLETTVSEIPPSTTGKSAVAAAQKEADDVASSCGDPTEVFHRDIGVQTVTPPLTPAPARQQQQEADQGAAQARRLSGLVSSLKEVNRGIVAQSEGYGVVKMTMDIFKDDLDQMSRPYPGQFGSGYTIYGSAGRREPDDEVKAVKENIRRVKGVLLSARSFPVAGR